MPKLTGNRCKCPACGEYFNSPRAFDGHRTGPHDPRVGKRICLNPKELGMPKNELGFWLSLGASSEAA